MLIRRHVVPRQAESGKDEGEGDYGGGKRGEERRLHFLGGSAESDEDGNKDRRTEPV